MSEEQYRRTVYDLLAWLELSGVGSYARPACGACASGRLSQRELAYDKALKRMGAHLNRERKLARKAAHIAGPA